MLQIILTLVIFVLLIIPIGRYMFHIATGQHTFCDPVFNRIDNGIYRICGINQNEGMGWKKYALALVLTNAVMVFIGYLILRIQFLPVFNPNGIGAMEPTLSFNTIISFMTNTNLQHYSGESGLSYLSQMLVIIFMMFVSASTGYAACVAFCRGLTGTSKNNLGNFYVDLVRITTRILIPFSIIVTLILVWQGAPQNFMANQTVTTIEGTQQDIAMGPIASLVSIKHLGTNGGGFFGVNSAFPYENATPLSNIIEALCLLLIPAALCFTFGKAVKDTRQGKTILVVMTVIFVAALVGLSCAEIFGAPSWDSVASLGGSMEGKETRFGVGGSSLWAAATTAASNGSVNAMHDSLTPLGGMITMFLMQLGEVVFGGVGCGLYGMLAFALLTVFMAGLMVGRTPEYIGKKINAFDMKMVCIIILVPPLCLLLATAITTLFPAAQQLQADGGWLSNTGSHGFSEILYAYTSMAGNNGSAFAGFQANTVLTNVMGGTVMLLVRFLPMVAVIYLAQSLASKKYVPAGSGTLATTSPLFVGFLIVIVLIVGALTFLPVLALGPLAEFFTQLHVLG